MPLAKALANILYSILWLVLVTTFGVTVLLLRTNYDTLIQSILSQLQRPDLYSTLTSTYFTPQRFSSIQQFLWFVLPLLLGSIYLLFRYRKKILDGFRTFLDYIIQLGVEAKIKIASNRWLWLALVLLAIRTGYNFFRYDMQFDEVWNYNYFLHHSFWFSLVAYNNYPLHNLITSFFLWILPDTPFTIRLPIMIAGVIAGCSIYLSVFNLFRSKTQALFAVIIFASLPISIYYMLYARGIMVYLVWLFPILVLTLRNLEHPLSQKQHALLGLFHVLALFTMLSHAYLLVGLILVSTANNLLLHQGKQAWQTLRRGLLYMILSALPLVPMLLGTGWGKGFSKGRWLALHGSPYSCYAEFFTGFGWAFYVLLLWNGGAFFLFPNKKDRAMLVLNCILLISPWCIYFVTDVYPPERALAYLVWPVVISILYACRLFSNLKLSGALVLFVAGAMHTQAYTGLFMNWSHRLDKKVQELSAVLLKQNIHSLYTHHKDLYYFHPGLEFYYHLANQPIDLATSTTSSTRFQPYNNRFYYAAIAEDTALHRGKIPLFRLDDWGVYIQH